MARTATRAEMRDDAYRFADLESATARFPLAEANVYVDKGVAKVYARLVRARGAGYYESSASFSTSAGIDPTSLSASFFELLKVSITANGRTLPLTRHELAEEDSWQYFDSSQRGVPVTYRIQGDNLSLRPIPDGVYTVSYKFIPAPPKLTNDASTFDGLCGFETLVSLYAAQFMCLKERDREGMGMVMDMIKKEEADLDSLACVRDAYLPARIIDVRALERGY